MDSAQDIASAFVCQRRMGLSTGMLVTNPVPEEYAMDDAVINGAIEKALCEAEEHGIHGKQITPFLLAKITELTSGQSLATNIRLVKNNALLAAHIACLL